MTEKEIKEMILKLLKNDHRECYDHKDRARRTAFDIERELLRAKVPHTFPQVEYHSDRRWASTEVRLTNSNCVKIEVCHRWVM